jgi:hypothetical protein
VVLFLAVSTAAGVWLVRSIVQALRRRSRVPCGPQADCCRELYWVGQSVLIYCATHQTLRAVMDYEECERLRGEQERSGSQLPHSSQKKA